MYFRKKKTSHSSECNTAMKVSFNDTEYSLLAGRNKVFNIWLTEGDNILTFKGTGVISIDYRGGSL